MDKLASGEVEQYRTEGFVVVPELIDAEALREVDRAIRELTDQALSGEDFSSILELEPDLVDGQRVPRRIYNPFNQHQAFRSLGSDDRILDRIEQLIGDNIQLQHSKLNMKPAKVGSVVEWHQDYTYFPHTNEDLVTTLVYLDDATEDNGCLQVLPRRQHAYLNHTTDDGMFAGMITEDISGGNHGNPVTLPAPAGSVIFMNVMTPHSSLPNRSDHGRRTVIFEYRASDAYPLYFGEMVSKNEVHTCQLRGEPANRARFGAITPLIPRFPGVVNSLYELQNKTKADRSNPM